jgi:hypothetical protein
VGLEWGPLGLVSTTEELLDRKSIGFSLENRDYIHRDPPSWSCDIPLLSVTLSPSGGGCSVGIVRSQTKAMD